MSNIVELCIKWAVPFFCAGLSGFVAKTLKAFQRDTRANSTGTKVLLEDKLLWYHKKYVENGDGTIPLRSLEICTAVYTAYHGLNGNGTGTKMFNDIQELQIKGE